MTMSDKNKILQTLKEEGLEDKLSENIAEKVSEIVNNDAEELYKSFEYQKIVDEYGDGNEGSNLYTIMEWGKSNLPKELSEHLLENHKGIKTLENMMLSSNNAVHDDEKPQEDINEESLIELMRKPEYWLQNDNDLTKAVSDGFKKLYGKKE